MDVTVMIAIAAACFIVGILCIAKGTSVEEQDAVPISNPSEIKELKKTFEPAISKDNVSNEFKVQLKAAPPGSKPEEENVSAVKSSDQFEINQLTKNNQQLEKELREQKESYKQMKQNVEILKTEFVQVKDRGNQQVKALEEKIAAMQKDQGQMQDSSALDDLRTKVASLEKQREESKNQESKLNEVIKQLGVKKEELEKVQKPAIGPDELDLLSNRLSGSIAAIETLKGENKKLQISNDKLKGNFDKTKEFNQCLLDKENIMQFELVKNRAQTLGLEKICEDFRKQIESMNMLTESK